MSTARRIMVVCAVTLTLAACGHAAGGPAPQTVTATGGPTLSGKDVHITAYEGHPVVLVFWASWCGPCHDEQPQLNDVYAKWASRGVEFLGIDLRDDTKDALAFQSQLKVPYPSIADTQATLAVDYRIPSAPAMVFLDTHGKVADVVLGALGTMSVADCNTEISTLIGAQSASA